MLLKRDNLLVSAIDTHLATTWSRGAEEADAAREAVAVAQIEMAHLLLFHRKVGRRPRAMKELSPARAMRVAHAHETTRALVSGGASRTCNGPSDERDWRQFLIGGRPRKAHQASRK